MVMIEHKMLKTIHLKYSGRDGISQIAKTLFSLWSLVKENAQIIILSLFYMPEYFLKSIC